MTGNVMGRTFLRAVSFVFFFACYSQAQQLDPLNNFCQRYYHQATIKNNTLYIDGGGESFVQISDGTYNYTYPLIAGTNEYLIAVPLSESWDWTTNITEHVLPKLPDPQTGNQPPVVARGGLFSGHPDDPNIYLYGGTTLWNNVTFRNFEYPTTDQYSLWSYNTQSATWNQYDVSPNVQWRPSSFAWTEAPEQGLAFCYNGEIDSGSSIETQNLGDGSKMFLKGLVVVNTTQQSAQNYSTQSSSGDYPRTRGALQYVPGIGASGILVAFGGTFKAWDEIGSDEESNYMPMTEIDIFDVNSLYNTTNQTTATVWYKQNATGDIPIARDEFCAVVMSAPDNSSHNIYMYGGHNVATNQVFDEVWVLSLPSFTWTQVYASTLSPRYAHSCHRVGNSQMITVGGITTTSIWVPPCDWENKSVAILDLSYIRWGSVYNAQDDPYQVPVKIQEVIGGDGNGSATMKFPQGGFSDCALANLFGFESNQACTPPVVWKANREAEIVGATVGSVAGAIILILLILLWRSRGRFWSSARFQHRSEKGKQTGRTRTGSTMATATTLKTSTSTLTTAQP